MLADAGRLEGMHEKFQPVVGSNSSGGHSGCTAAIWGNLSGGQNSEGKGEVPSAD